MAATTRDSLPNQIIYIRDSSVTNSIRALRIDVHAHYYSDRFIDLIESRGCDCGACVRRDARGPIIDAGPLHAGPLASRFIDLDQRIADMDAQGVDVQALSLTQPMVYWAEENLARELSATFNDDLVAAHERFPDRLVGLAMLPMHHPKSALDELARVKAAPGIRGIYMGTAIGDMDLSHESLLPVFEAIEEAGLPVLLHPLKVLGMTDRLKPYFLANLLGNPFDTAVAAAHLIFGGVLDRFPKLDVVLPHAGGALPFLVGRLQHGWSVRPELKHMERGPEEYLARFYFDTIAHSQSSLQYLIAQVGADRVMLGSDYCFDMGLERPIEVVEAQEQLSDTLRDQILGGTARSLLKL
ncbi:amidohydrolase family protein [Devosia sp. 1566]|uniref:amidohydrolase family protein n=1 Tax=Devosia sp. 1566 TaxID=2499144 RepID=UPI000FD6ECD7|nr:amidohydrolase family protein [Devosia sp. 1566]